MGSLNGKKGVFPSNFVMEQAEKSNPGKTENHSNANVKSCDNEDPSEEAQSHTNRMSKPSNSMGFGNIFKDGAIKLKSTNELSPDDKTQTGRSTPSVIAVSSMDIELLVQQIYHQIQDPPKLPPKPAREQAVALYPYEALLEDELNLTEGDIITVLSKDVEDHGWWKGEVNGKFGLFPDNFVELISDTELSPSKPCRPELPLHSATKPQRPTSPKSQEIINSKGEPGLPVTSSSSKKRRLPPSIKKPQCSPKPAVSTPPSAKKPSSVKIRVSSGGNNPVQELLTDDMKAKSQEDKTISDFNGIEVHEDKLTHLTANRVKAPNRRPPSQFVTKENDQLENGMETSTSQPHWMKELKKTQKAKRSSQISQDSESISLIKESNHIEIPPKPSPPRKPSPVHKEELKKKTLPVAPVTTQTFHSPVKQEKEKIFVKSESKPKVQEKANIETKPKDTAGTVPSPMASVPSPMAPVITELRKELEEMKRNTVSKADFIELKDQFTSLKEAHETQRVKFNKRLTELMTELDEEKKLRMSMTVEVERVKKLAMS
ncbi:CD2-associated protein [Nymphon striatum]|nr:CD2-associated protein [Nymphon striatum]